VTRSKPRPTPPRRLAILFFLLLPPFKSDILSDVQARSVFTLFMKSTVFLTLKRARVQARRSFAAYTRNRSNSERVVFSELSCDSRVQRTRLEPLSILLQTLIVNGFDRTFPYY